MRSLTALIALSVTLLAACTPEGDVDLQQVGAGAAETAEAVSVAFTAQAGELASLRATIEAPSATPTPTPIPAVTPISTASPVPAPTPTITPSATPNPTTVPTPTVAPTATQIPVPTSTLSPTPSPTATATALPTSTPFPTPTPMPPPVAQRASVDIGGLQLDEYSYEPSVSADGRYVVYKSSAELRTNPGDIYIFDRLAGSTTGHIFRDADGLIVSENAERPSISPDGNWVAFWSGNAYVAEIATGVASLITSSVLPADQIPRDSMSPERMALSNAGSTIAFWSARSDLVTGDTNNSSDVFIRNVIGSGGQTIRISVKSDGSQVVGDSIRPSISSDGNHVAFNSRASELIGGEASNNYQIYVRNLQTDELLLVSASSSGDAGNDHAHQPSISADGRYVAFSSPSNNLVGGIDGGRDNVFVKDSLSGKITMVSRSMSGGGGDGDSSHASISADGRFVCFDSSATNLVPEWTGDRRGDIYIADITSGVLWLVTAGPDGSPSDKSSQNCAFSGDGKYVVFMSEATNLVANDTNGVSDIFIVANPLN